MANGSMQVSAESSRSLEMAAAELAKSMGQHPNEILDDLVSEVRILEQSARVKQFIVTLAIKSIKERLRHRHERSPLCELSSNSQDSAEKAPPLLGDGLPESQFT